MDDYVDNDEAEGQPQTQYEDTLIREAITAIRQAKTVLKNCYVNSMDAVNEEALREAIGYMDQALGDLPETEEIKLQKHKIRKSRYSNE